MNSVLDLFRSRFTSWSSTPAVGDRSSRVCFCIPSGEFVGFGLVELSRTDDSAAAR